MKKALFVFLLSAVLGIGTVVWWKVSLLPVNPNDKTSRSFVVAKGDGIKEVSIRLREAGLIRNKLPFCFGKIFYKRYFASGIV